MEKFLGVRPAGIGDIFQRMIGKWVLLACRYNVTHDCVVDRILSCLRGVIEVGIREMKFLWEHHNKDIGWVLIIFDAQNMFNEINCAAMLWNMRYT